MVQEPQDFHEFMPNEVWKWKILEEKIEKVLSLHDFQEIRLSILQDSQILENGIMALVQGKEAKDDIVKIANKYFTDNYLQVKKKTGNYPKNNLKKPGFAPIIPQNSESKSDFAKEMEQIKTLDAHPRFLDFNNDG